MTGATDSDYHPTCHLVHVQDKKMLVAMYDCLEREVAAQIAVAAAGGMMAAVAEPEEVEAWTSWVSAAPQMASLSLVKMVVPEVAVVVAEQEIVVVVGGSFLAC